MSLSKVAGKCQFCGIGKGIYSCPRCSQKYCSSICYKSRNHESCSESFFKEWIEETLQQESVDRSNKEQMLNLLQNFEEESEGAAGYSEPSIEDRFASLNLNNLDGTDLWTKLNDEEKAKFKAFIEDNDNLEEIVPLKQPWWASQTLNLVLEFDSDGNDIKDDLAPRPPFPLNVKILSEMTSAKPSSCIQHNLVNIIYSYAFLCRFYNCDLRDFLEEVVDSLFILSPVMSEGQNYLTLVESVQDSIRLICKKHSELPISFVKSIVDDVSNIMLGPKNARPSTYVLCALHDIKLIFTEMKSLNRGNGVADKSRKKILNLAVKRIEYYMGWTSEYESTLSEISSDLVLLMLPDLIPDSNICEPDIEHVNVGKPLIEEIE